MLSKEELKKYFKQILLDDIGLKGQLLLKKAKVAVVGAGGLGCPVLQYLSSCGVGTIGIIDFDTVDVSNLHRQILYSVDDVGKKKAEVAAIKIQQLNKECFVNIHADFLNENKALEIFSNYDLIIDGSDNFLTRYAVNDACVNLNIPLVYGSILGFEGQLSVFNHHESKNLRDLFPDAPNPEDVPDCSENGVLGSLPGIIGTMMANEALKIILGLPSLKNQLIIFDTKNLSFNKIAF